MGTYFGVNKIKKLGQPVVVTDIKPVIPNNSFLVAIVCNGIWAIAPEVTDKREYDEFYNSYCAGNWLSFKLYSIREENRNKCPDEGRVPC